MVNRGLKDQIQDLQNRLIQAESRASELIDTNAQLQRQTHELEQANAMHKSTLDRQVADIQNLEHQLNDASAKTGSGSMKANNWRIILPHSQARKQMPISRWPYYPKH